MEPQAHVTSAEDTVGVLKEAADTTICDLKALVGATSMIFGSDVCLFEDCDPEFADQKYTVFAVETSLSPKGIVEAEQEWVRALRRIAPSSWESVRLLIRAKR